MWKIKFNNPNIFAVNAVYSLIVFCVGYKCQLLNEPCLTMLSG